METEGREKKHQSFSEEEICSPFKQPQREIGNEKPVLVLVRLAWAQLHYFRKSLLLCVTMCCHVPLCIDLILTFFLIQAHLLIRSLSKISRFWSFEPNCPISTLSSVSFSFFLSFFLSLLGKCLLKINISTNSMSQFRYPSLIVFRLIR